MIYAMQLKQINFASEIIFLTSGFNEYSNMISRMQSSVQFKNLFKILER